MDSCKASPIARHVSLLQAEFIGTCEPSSCYREVFDGSGVDEEWSPGDRTQIPVGPR